MPDLLKRKTLLALIFLCKQSEISTSIICLDHGLNSVNYVLEYHVFDNVFSLIGLKILLGLAHTSSTT